MPTFLWTCEIFFFAGLLIHAHFRTIHRFPGATFVQAEPADADHSPKCWHWVAHVVTSLAPFLALPGPGQLSLSQAMPRHSWALVQAKDDSQMTVWGYTGGLYRYVYDWLPRECILALQSWSAKTYPGLSSERRGKNNVASLNTGCYSLQWQIHFLAVYPRITEDSNESSHWYKNPFLW